MSEPARYRFGPLERRGLIAGWRGGQIGAVASGLVIAVVALRGYPGSVGVTVALVSVCGTAAAACWPVHGRTTEEWAPVLLRYCGSRRWRFHRSVAPTSGIGAATRREPSGEAMFAGLVVVGVRSGGRTADAGARNRVQPQGVLNAGRTRDGEVGVVIDRRNRTYTTVLALRGSTFALLSSSEKERTVSRWSGVLADLSRENSVLHRVQWVASAIPDDGHAADRYLAERAVLSPSAPARQSYADLVSRTGASACRHEVMLAVQVRANAASARAIRSAGGGDSGGCLVVLREAASLRRRLGDTDVIVERALGPDDLAQVVRRSWESGPSGLVEGDDWRTAPGPGSVVDPAAWPWPMGIGAAWADVRTDATWHATYWIAEWPRVDVGPDFLAPLLLGTMRRSVSVVMEPISPSRAIRQVHRARTADVADAELRHRGGFLATARRSREAQTVERREEELAEGHASFRFSGYVTVTASSPEELALACDETEQSAGQCRLELRRLYGDQARALAYTLPLGRGLS